MEAFILGTDPGFAHFGYSLLTVARVVKKLGVIVTKKATKKQNVFAADDNVQRAREIYRALIKLMPGVVVIAAESMSFPRNSSAAAKMAMSWGVIVALSEQFDVPIVQASPQRLKALVEVPTAKRRGKNEAPRTSKERDQVRKASKFAVQNALNKLFEGQDLGSLLVDVPETSYEHAYDSLASAVFAADSECARVLRARS